MKEYRKFLEDAYLVDTVIDIATDCSDICSKVICKFLLRSIVNTPGRNRQFDRASPTPIPLKSYTLSVGPTPSV